MTTKIENGYEIFTDKSGKPLENGYILIGEYGLNPISNPKQAYWDEDLTIPASNIRTSGGYPVYQGSPGRLYVEGGYSIIVKDSHQNVVYTQLEGASEEATYGQEITLSLGDILFLDGSPSLVTSKGAEPVAGFNSVTYVPSQVQSGDSLADNSDVKFPGKRGAWDLTNGNLTYDITLLNSGFTLDGWFYYSGGAIDETMLALSNGSDSTNRIRLYSDSGVLTLATSTSDTGSTMPTGWNHIKLVAKNDFNIDVYLNGFIDIADLALGTSDYTNLDHLSIGNKGIYSSGNTWKGNISDVHYAPYVDSSTNHYDSNLPWTDPNSEYGENGIYKRNPEVGTVDPVPDDKSSTFGEDIQPNDILISDGTPNQATSEGAQPLEGYDTRLYVPSQYVIDGERIANPNVFWPGRRGAEYIGDEYENLIPNPNNVDSWDATNITTADQKGEWIELNNAATTEYIFVLVESTGSNINILHAGEVSVGAGDIGNVVTQLQIGNSITATINYATETVTVGSGGTGVIDYNFITLANGDKVCQYWAGDVDVDAIYTHRIYPNTIGTGVSVRFRNVMSINFGSTLPYKVPYFEGVLPAANKTYPHEWGQQGTLSFPFEVNFDYDTPEDKMFLDNRAFMGTSANRLLIYYRASSDQIRIVVRNEAGSEFYFDTDVFTVGTWLSRGLHYVTFGYDLSNGDNFFLSFDGGADLLTAKATLSGTFNLNPFIGAGLYAYDLNQPQRNLQGLVGPIHFRKTLDTSTEHYASGLPWRDPNCEYSENGSWKKNYKYGDTSVGQSAYKAVRTEEGSDLEYEQDIDLPDGTRIKFGRYIKDDGLTTEQTFNFATPFVNDGNEPAIILMQDGATATFALGSVDYDSIGVLIRGSTGDNAPSTAVRPGSFIAMGRWK